MSLPGKAGEGPLDYLTRCGYEVSCYNGLRIARKFTKERKCVADYNAPTMRELAKLLGWYP